MCDSTEKSVVGKLEKLNTDNSLQQVSHTNELISLAPLSININSEANDYQGFNSSQPSSCRVPSRRISITDDSSSKDAVLLVLVGLPARGKSYIAKKICRYLNWRGHTACVFNVGASRREKSVRGATTIAQNAHFFDPNNACNAQQRDSIALEVLDNALAWLSYDQGQVAIFDATNSTQQRRKLLMDRCANSNIRVLFIESLCDDPIVLERNLLTKVSKSPDYCDMQTDEAMQDLKMRIEQYEKAYQPLSDNESLSYIKIINLRSKLVCNDVRGSLPRHVAFFLMHQHPKRMPIWLVRAAHTENQTLNRSSKKIADIRQKTCSLSAFGNEFARRLAHCVAEYSSDEFDTTGQDFAVWTSTILRAKQTAQFLPQRITEWSALNMMDMGTFDGWTQEKIAAEAPAVYSAWQSNRDTYRFPGGECYADVRVRLDPLVLDLESLTKPLLIISHLSCLRHLYSYFTGVEMPESDVIPAHTILQFTPTSYGWSETRTQLLSLNEYTSYSKKAISPLSRQMSSTM